MRPAAPRSSRMRRVGIFFAFLLAIATIVLAIVYPGTDLFLWSALIFVAFMLLLGSPVLLARVGKPEPKMSPRDEEEPRSDERTDR